MHDFEIISVFCEPDRGFLGNTAAVLLLDKAATDEQMQRFAGDMNQPATTFLWPADIGDSYHVRWFAPDAEIGLCGHGTLAALAFFGAHKQTVYLHYRSGVISGICGNGESASMILAAIPVVRELEIPELLPAGLGVPVEEYYQTTDKNIVVVKDEMVLKRMKPDFWRLRQMDTFGYAVTAPGREVDFVSRTLVPHVQQLEDHATGSSHAALTPFWGKRLQKNELTAWQLSPRGGALACKLLNGGDEVALSGQYRKVARGQVAKL